MLHFELKLSQDLIIEILDDYKQFAERVNGSQKIIYDNERYLLKENAKFDEFDSNLVFNGTRIRYVYYDLWFKECFNF